MLPEAVFHASVFMCAQLGRYVTVYVCVSPFKCVPLLPVYLCFL